MFGAANLAIECKPLKSKRYISDGFCTSIKPIVDFVCTGTCMPIRDLPWYAEFVKVWSHNKYLQYRCVDDVVRHKKVTLVCDNGDTRSYKIKVVRNCKCKRYVRSQNESPSSSSAAARRVNSGGKGDGGAAAAEGAQRSRPRKQRHGGANARPVERGADGDEVRDEEEG